METPSTVTAPESRQSSFTIGAKLIVIISILVLLSLGTITALVTYYVSSDVQLTAEENNHTVNSRSATTAEAELATIRANVFLLLDMINAAGSSGSLARQAAAFFFERNQTIAAIILSDADGRTASTLYANNRFFLSNEIDRSPADQFLDLQKEYVSRAELGEVFALNVSPSFGIPVMALVYPWSEWGFPQSVSILFSTEALNETFGTGSLNTSFMVNHQGDLLVHPERDLVLAGLNINEYPLVREMRSRNDLNRQIRYSVDSEEVFQSGDYFGAYRQLPVANIGVLTTIPVGIVFDGVRRTTIQNIWLTAAVLCAAILFIWFFSKSISRPVKRLAEASADIARGKYDISISTRSKDELGFLTKRFNEMAVGLAERERLKDTFGRFINPEIAQKAARGELTLGGETKTATVFFSDIRSFTSISEKLEPFEVVEFLNEYMTRMVECVKTTNGVVDKFIGDAVMAIWGAPVSSGSVAEDAKNCVRAALMMRSALIEFNKGRGGDKKPVIRIGCGINTGELIAGQIGSTERMEYTVIGDAVNLASRTESLNKPFCTDILITEHTRKLLGDYALVEQMPSVSVKGKTEKIQLYAVINIPSEKSIPGAGANGPSTLKDVRRMVGLPEPDYQKAAIDGDEKKYTINS